MDPGNHTRPRLGKHAEDQEGEEKVKVNMRKAKDVGVGNTWRSDDNNHIADHSRRHNDSIWRMAF